jgi:hypothetical protein
MDPLEAIRAERAYRLPSPRMVNTYSEKHINTAAHEQTDEGHHKGFLTGSAWETATIRLNSGLASFTASMSTASPLYVKGETTIDFTGLNRSVIDKMRRKLQTVPSVPDSKR